MPRADPTAADPKGTSLIVAGMTVQKPIEKDIQERERERERKVDGQDKSSILDDKSADKRTKSSFHFERIR